MNRAPGFFSGWRVVCTCRATTAPTPGYRFWPVRVLCMASDLTQLRERSA